MVFGGAVVAFRQPAVSNFIDTQQKEFGLFLSPTQEFERAIANTNEYESGYLEYDSDITMRITNLRTGLSEISEATMNGYTTGDEERSQLVLRIGSPNVPGSEVSLEVIVDQTDTDDETYYVRGPATGSKWVKLSAEEYHAESDEPYDSTLFGFDLMSTLLDNDALLSSYDAKSLEYLGEEQQDNTTVKKYRVDIAVPDLVAKLDADEEYFSDKEIKELRQALSSAALSAVLYVDVQKAVISKMEIQADNVEQIIPEIAVELMRQTNDISMTVTLSKLGLPNDIQLPAEESVVSQDDVLGASTSVSVDMLQ